MHGGGALHDTGRIRKVKVNCMSVEWLRQARCRDVRFLSVSLSISVRVARLPGTAALNSVSTRSLWVLILL